MAITVVAKPAMPRRRLFRDLPLFQDSCAPSSLLGPDIPEIEHSRVRAISFLFRFAGLILARDAARDLEREGGESRESIEEHE
ncbi:MAG: hypothetical protein SF339_00310 [Blastocatellia bacterium]|nr:hypothetical protein [Blastocatellia bacterium]